MLRTKIVGQQRPMGGSMVDMDRIDSQPFTVHVKR